MSRGWAGFVLAIALVAACKSSNDGTKIVVAVWSDLAVPTEVDSVHIKVTGPTSSSENTFTLNASGASGKTKLPVELELVPDAASNATFTVTAVGMLGHTELVGQSARVSFVSGKSLLLRLFLGRACEGVTCSPSFTCALGTCDQPIEVPTLPPYTEPLTGFDAGTGRDGALERDAPLDYAADGAGDQATRDAGGGLDARDATDAAAGAALDGPAPDAGCIVGQNCLPPANGTATCVAGRCVMSCNGGFKKTGDECRYPSCASLGPTCGPGHDDDCCAYDDVPGGSFVRGNDTSGVSQQDGMDIVGWQDSTKTPVKIDDFSLGRYEVTVGRFRAFLSDYDRFIANNPDVGAGGDPHNTKAGWQCGWRGKASLSAQSAAEFRANIAKRKCSNTIGTWLDDATKANDNKPMTCVNWYEAYMFCIWDSARLPTDAEWNYAAAGGNKQLAYPWGTPENLDPDSSYANVNHTGADVYLEDVGSHPAGKGRWGHHDLAGNAAELVMDGCTDCKSYSNEATDPVDVDKVSFPNDIARGGSYKYPWPHARTAYRLQTTEGAAYDDLGWRCAMPVALGAPICNNPTAMGGASGASGAGGAGGHGGAVGGAGGASGGASGTTPKDGGIDAIPPCDPATSHRCPDGVCAANDDPSRCGDTCVACKAPAGGRVSCTANVCVPSCPTGRLCATANACLPNDVNACGDTCTKCEAPTGGKVSCDGSKCIAECASPSTQHICGTACVSNSDLQTCGPTSCTACPVPANAVATCDGSKCSSDCKSGFHACSPGGPCVLNDESACGPSCTPCPSSTPSTTWTCDGSQCVGVCNSGFAVCPGSSSCTSTFSKTSCGPTCFDCSTLGWPTRCDGTQCCDDGTRCQAP
jgi:sulfatase modifying factor 1